MAARPEEEVYCASSVNLPDRDGQLSLLHPEQEQPFSPLAVPLSQRTNQTAAASMMTPVIIVSIILRPLP